MADTFAHPYTTAIAYSTDGVLGVGTTFTTLASVRMTNWPVKDSGVANVTVLASTSKTTEHQQGWRQAGAINFELRFLQANYQTLNTFWAAGTILTWKFTAPLVSTQVSGFYFTQAGFVKKLEISEASTENDDTLTIKVELQMTGVATPNNGA